MRARALAWRVGGADRSLVDGIRRGSATVLGPLLVLVAIVAGLYMGLVSLSIAFSRANCFDDRGYWCPSVLARVAIGFGLMALGLSAALLIGRVGRALWRYAWEEGALRWRFGADLVAGPLLAVAWFFCWLLYLGSIGAFD